MSERSSFAARLRELRVDAKMTQHELAEKAGMHRQGIAHLEGGTRQPTWDTVRALARALGVTCQAFDEPPPEEAPRPRGRPKKAEGEAAPSEKKSKARKRKES